MSVFCFQIQKRTMSQCTDNSLVISQVYHRNIQGIIQRCLKLRVNAHLLQGLLISGLRHQIYRQIVYKGTHQLYQIYSIQTSMRKVKLKILIGTDLFQDSTLVLLSRSRTSEIQIQTTTSLTVADCTSYLNQNVIPVGPHVLRMSTAFRPKTYIESSLHSLTIISQKISISFSN